ncbi:hypothetical protein [Nocardioides sp.]|nr:hypothetical protein [Nocardioides sp.]
MIPLVALLGLVAWCALALPLAVVVGRVLHGPDDPGEESSQDGHGSRLPA